MTYGIAAGDLDTRVRQAAQHLENGCRVKLEMKLKGRQNAHPDIALEKMVGVVERLKGPRIVVEKQATLSGRLVEAQLIAKLKL